MDIKTNTRINPKEFGFYSQGKQKSNKNITKTSEENETFLRDTISISPEAKNLNSKQKDSVDGEGDLAEIQRMFKELKESSSSKDDSLDALTKCLIIATRITNGDHVPVKDMEFLAENQPKMYMNALLMRKENDQPEKYESLLKDDKKTIEKRNELKGESMDEKVVESFISSFENDEIYI